MYLRTGHLFSTLEDIPLLLLHRTCHARLRRGLSHSDARRGHRPDRAHDRQGPHRPCVAVEVAAERNVEAGRSNRLARQQAQPPVVFDRYEGLDRPPWGTAHHAPCGSPQSNARWPTEKASSLIATLPARPLRLSRCVATARRGQAASSPLPLLQGRSQVRLDLFRRATGP
jgi:hypothetical protein